MREILFRAKRMDNGEWVEGYLFRLSENHPPFIMLSDRYGESHEVDPFTICQYIGLTDNNGEKIWENDICIIHSSNIDEEDGYFTVEWDDDSGRFILNGDSLTVDFDNFYGHECEVIGNIFDNPELLEVEE